MHIQSAEVIFQSTLPAWGATTTMPDARTSSTISIHAPRVGSDRVSRGKGGRRLTFQSTLPAWGATHVFPFLQNLRQDFNPRSPRGERRAGGVISQPHVWISIHAPRVGSDDGLVASRFVLAISIHAPRVGSDEAAFRVLLDFLDISIHAPRVGSDIMPYRIRTSASSFQSTLPAWGATRFCGRFL